MSNQFNHKLFKTLSFRLFIKSDGYIFFFCPKSQIDLGLLKNYLIISKIDYKIFLEIKFYFQIH